MTAAAGMHVEVRVLDAAMINMAAAVGLQVEMHVAHDEMTRRLWRENYPAGAAGSTLVALTIKGLRDEGKWLVYTP